MATESNVTEVLPLPLEYHKFNVVGQINEDSKTRCERGANELIAILFLGSITSVQMESRN